ncbi:integral membrane protein GPR137B [Eucyclogobius newberryi]|uniref:integral membrane protein GPR137B n=1 Tax=Eucyclogobius newberryi TaxID=166745 RepID=UPI003B5C33B8
MSLAIGLHSKGPSACQLTLVGLALVLVSGSRTSYNLTVLSLTDHSPGSGPGPSQAHWYHVTDQVRPGLNPLQPGLNPHPYP